MKNLILTLFAISMLFSCEKENLTFQEQLDIDVEIIETYLTTNNITALNEQGVYYVIEDEGSGSTYPTSSALVSMAYSGTVMNGDGTIFDSRTSTNPLKSNLANLIAGWRVGVPKFKKGGKGKLYIPSGYAYGVFGSGGDIPGNSILIFDVELLDFTN
ncbi:MAG: FKBP-type peptidyl-prolyl cis-trans isomerase [Saprospiraceae bacterium]